MNEARHERLSEIYLAARALHGAERVAYLERECGGDAELRAEVLAMLDVDAATPGFLDERGTIRATAVSDLLETAGAPLPERIGAYRILALLGEGGMGVVYSAEQENPRRVVALKMIRSSFAGKDALRRFAAEGHILGRLKHPGIAQIHEAGTIETQGGGRLPYFAMELVEGRPIGEYVAESKASVRAILELVARVCDAVEHAHRKSVVHRDLKPSNILVEATGQPKILDFGVARVLEGERTGASFSKTGGEIVGTLSYMSPEQAVGDTHAIDTRSDVYSLGVVLYELLTGRLPHDLKGKSVARALLTVAEVDPPPLSSVRKDLAGDVDAIVAKAMARDPERRYSGAGALAADLRAHLRFEPIEARPATKLDLARRFVLRHRLGVLAAAAIVVSLATGMIVALVQKRNADERRIEAEIARDDAESARANTDAINQYLLLDMLGSADPRRDGRAVRVVDVLARAVAGIAHRFAGRPTLEAAIRDTLGTSFRALGLYDEAIEQIDVAVVLRESILGAEHVDTLTSKLHLLQALGAKRDFERGIPLGESLCEALTRIHGSDDVTTLAARNTFASMRFWQGDATALDDMRTIAAARERVLGPDDASTLQTLNNLSVILLQTGNYAEAEELARRVLEARQRSLGAEHPDTLMSEQNLAQLLEDQGRMEDAEPIYRRLHEIQLRVHGPDHPETTYAKLGLAIAWSRLGKRDDAEPLYLQAIDVRSRHLGATHAETLSAKREFVRFRIDQGRLDEARELAVELVATMREVSGPQSLDLAGGLNTLSRIEAMRRDYVAAEKTVAEAIAIYRSLPGGTNPSIHQSLYNLATIVRDGGDPARALPIYDELIAIDSKRYGERHEKVANDHGGRAKALLTLERFAEAEASYATALDLLADKTAANSQRGTFELGLGRALLAQQKTREAATVLKSAALGLHAKFGANHDGARDAIRLAADAFDSLGESTEAAALRGKLESR